MERARLERRASIQVRSSVDQGAGLVEALLADEGRLPSKPEVRKLAKHQLSKSVACFLSRLTCIISHVRGKIALAAFSKRLALCQFQSFKT